MIWPAVRGMKGDMRPLQLSCDVCLPVAEGKATPFAGDLLGLTLLGNKDFGTRICNMTQSRAMLITLESLKALARLHLNGCFSLP